MRRGKFLEPVLIFDDDSRLCAWCAEQARRLLPTGYPVVVARDLDAPDALGLTRDDVRAALWWIGVDGRPSRGHRAIARAVLAMRRWWSPIAALALIPPLGWVAAGVWAAAVAGSQLFSSSDARATST